jgi:hypothetical protein
MNVYVHRRSLGQVAAWLEAAQFTVEAEMLHHPEPNTEGGFIFAHRSDNTNAPTVGSWIAPALSGESMRQAGSSTPHRDGQDAKTHGDD